MFESTALAANVQVKGLDELDDLEVGAKATTELDFKISKAAFEACIPQESKPFPQTLTADLESQIFTKKELNDWMDCELGECAFNFLNVDLQELVGLKTPEDYKMKFFQLLKDRTTRKTGIDPARSKHFLRSSDNAFQSCQSAELAQLLDSRPLKTDFRLSVVRYSSKMRPTTRITQGLTYPSIDGGLCYAEALIFSTHYDVDRVETWKTLGSALTYEFRYRIDLLNTWFRRLSKNKFRDEARRIAQEQMTKAIDCLVSHQTTSLKASPRVEPERLEKKSDKRN